MPDMPKDVTLIDIPPGTVRTGRQLALAGLIPNNLEGPIDEVSKKYSVAIPEGLIALIDHENPEDPIARQFVPDVEELVVSEDELVDPIGDNAFSPMRGLVHRYPDRVLLLPTLSCPVYCRYCFRRDQVGRAEDAPDREELELAITYIANNAAIREVILTGGDPLSLSNNRLRSLLNRLASIPHIDILRIHTRFPIAVPERITDALITALQTDIPVWMVLHCNHARELSKDVTSACNKLSLSGIPLLSQSVLLKGVNDDVETLTELFRALVRLKVKPYYLHHPDRARGTARFRVGLAESRALIETLRGQISGLCQPTYVVDIPGGHGKYPAQHASKLPDETGWLLGGWNGNFHKYWD